MDFLSSRETSESNTPTTIASDDELRLVVKGGHNPPSNTRSPLGPTESQNTDIIGSLWRLHADELAWLAQHKRPVVNLGEGFLPKVRIGAYCVSNCLD